jgi:hypothetical protein
MAQRFFAPANTAAEPGPDSDTDPPDPGGSGRTRDRRHAAAYLDLWERHLMHAAVHGESRSGRRGNGT